MKYLKVILLLFPFNLYAQEFIRTELPVELNVPWEITYGPDHYLWLTEKEGTVSRVDPVTGDHLVVYTAPDYFQGSVLENLPTCNSKLLVGTLGLALHPEFINPDSSYIYYVHSYNSGTVDAPATKFKIRRLKWDPDQEVITESIDLVTMIPTSYDHIGGRLIALKQNKKSYLFLSVGDHGISEMNNPECYLDQSENPNNLTQDPNAMNGKIHRYNIDGSIPGDNPIPGNSFYTRGHRNPQGLMYNPNLNQIYSIEHGDRTDDEVNILIKGMNYGWKDVRGYHNDQNFPGEHEYIENYSPHPNIENDSLVEAFYAWCTSEASQSDDNGNWCTVAPSDGIYYCSPAIPEWTNSLLVTTLKDGEGTDREVYQFKLNTDGTLAPSSVERPNPKRFFAEDQALNGRLRDITYAPDGKTIYLINSGGAPTNKITVYTLKNENVESDCFQVFPNPAQGFISLKNIDQLKGIESISIFSSSGKLMTTITEVDCQIGISNLSIGTYVIKVVHSEGICSQKFVKQ